MRRIARWGLCFVTPPFADVARIPRVSRPGELFESSLLRTELLRPFGDPIMSLTPAGDEKSTILKDCFPQKRRRSPI